MPNSTAWHAAGLLFENCNCQLVCPGHIHFTQLCTHERCQGYWAIRFESGQFGATPLGGLRAVVIYDTPQLMSSGEWTEGLYIDPVADDAQRAALEAILSGAAGGPWEVLGRFVAQRLPTQYVPIEITEEDGTKAVTIAGRLRSVIAAIRGRDRGQPVRFENIYNQIHSPSQVLARGDTDYNDGSLRIENRGSHGLWSQFSWKVE